MPAFAAQPIFTPSALVTDSAFTVYTGFHSIPQWNGFAGSQTTHLSGLIAAPSVSMQSGSGTLLALYGVSAFEPILFVTTIGAGVTVPLAAGYKVSNPSVAGGGAITELVGLELAALTSGAGSTRQERPFVGRFWGRR